MNKPMTCPRCTLYFDTNKHRPMIGNCGDTICAACQPKIIQCPKCDTKGSFRDAQINYSLLSTLEALEGKFEDETNNIDPHVPNQFNDETMNEDEAISPENDFGPAEPSSSSAINGVVTSGSGYARRDQPESTHTSSICTTCLKEVSAENLALSKEALLEADLAYIDVEGNLIPLLRNIPEIYIDQVTNEQRCMNCIPDGDAISLKEVINLVEKEKRESVNSYEAIRTESTQTSSIPYFQEFFDLPTTSKPKNSPVVSESQIAKLVRLHGLALNKLLDIEARPKDRYYNTKDDVDGKQGMWRDAISKQIDDTIEKLEDIIKQMDKNL